MRLLVQVHSVPVRRGGGGGGSGRGGEVQSGDKERDGQGGELGLKLLGVCSEEKGSEGERK